MAIRAVEPRATAKAMVRTSVESCVSGGGGWLFGGNTSLLYGKG